MLRLKHLWTRPLETPSGKECACCGMLKYHRHGSLHFKYPNGAVHGNPMSVEEPSCNGLFDAVRFAILSQTSYNVRTPQPKGGTTMAKKNPNRQKKVAPKSLTFDQSLEWYGLPGVPVSSMHEIATGVEVLHDFSMTQFRDLSTRINAAYPEIPSTQTKDPAQAHRKVAYAWQELCFTLNADLASGRDKARTNAQNVFAEPDATEVPGTETERAESAAKAATKETEMPATSTAPKTAPKAKAALKAKAAKAKTKAKAKAALKANGKTEAKAAKAEATKAAKAQAQAARVADKAAKAQARQEKEAAKAARRMFQVPGGKKYQLQKGFGMLGVVAVTIAKAAKSKKGLQPDDVVLIADCLAERDTNLGKDTETRSAAHYAGKAKTYIGHALRHLGLGKTPCTCSEIDPAFLAKPPVTRK